MKKNFIVLLIVAILCSGMVFAGVNNTGKQSGNIGENTLSGKSPADDATLTLQWDLQYTLNKWEIGFAAAPVNDASSVTAINTLDFNTKRGASDVHGEASAYVYWQLDTDQGLDIKLAGSGPLETKTGNQDSMLINWTATFTPVEVNTMGVANPSGVPITIGKLEDAINTNKEADTDLYKGTAPVTVFTMTKDNAAKGSLQRNGSAEVKVVTQNVHGLEKEPGQYAAALTLTIEAQA